MACPYAPVQRQSESVGVTIQKIENKFYDCFDLRMALQACRERVAREGQGHCLEYSRKVQLCKQKRKSQENSLSETCGKISLIRSLFELCSDERLTQIEKQKCQNRFDAYEKCISVHLLV